jgi:quinol monooxygenase YgiN
VVLENLPRKCKKIMVYVVTYIEVDPTLVKKTLYRLRDRDGFVCLQENYRTNRFAVLAQKEIPFLDEFTSQLIAPVEERRHDVLTMEDFEIRTGAVFVVTHIDVIPPEKDAGTQLVKQMCIDSRAEDGSIACNAFSQINRTNHMTVVESWRDTDAQAVHAANQRMKTFREKLEPLSGALYDERFYTLIG